MLDWIAWLPLLVAMLVVAVAPGYFWVRCSVRSSLVAAAAAPSLTIALLTILSVVDHMVGIPFGRASALPVLAVSALAGAAVFLARRRRHPALGIALGDDAAPRPPLRGDAPSSHAYRILGARARLAMWGLVALGWLVAALPMLTSADPADPVQQWDPTFHMSGVWNILQTGQAQPNGGLSPLYDGRSVFYPDAWHAFTSLFSTLGTVVQASNVSSLFIMAVWVVGATAFTAVVSTSRTAVLAAPVIAGCLLNMPADALTMYSQWPNALGVCLIPGLAAIAVVLGRRLERATETGLGGIVPHLPLTGLLALGALGAAAAHPSSLFALLAVLLVPLIASLWRLVRRSAWLGDWASTAVFALAMVVVVAGPLLVLSSDRIRTMAEYPRHGISWLEAFAHFLTPYPPFTQSIGLGLTVAIAAVLSLLGVIASLTAAHAWNALAVRAYPDLRAPFTYARPREEVSREAVPPSSGDEGGPASVEPLPPDEPDGPGRLGLSDASERLDDLPRAGEPEGAGRADLTRAWIGRREAIRGAFGPRPLLWPIGSYLVMAALTFLAYAPDSALRTFLTAPWYMDPRRIMEAQSLTVVPLAALGFEYAVNWLRSKRVRRADEHRAYSSGLSRIGILLGAWLLAMSLVGALDARIWAVGYVYDADNLGKPGMATSGELAMLRRMPQTLPADALVLGDPIAGAAYTEVLGQRRAVFPQLYHTLNDAHDEKVIVQEFNQIHTNPEVCEVVLRRGITYFYQDSDGYYYQYKRSERSPGLYDVDTSTGFELVDQGGTARLWRITACGE